jgi:hypothetical protein
MSRRTRRAVTLACVAVLVFIAAWLLAFGKTERPAPAPTPGPTPDASATLVPTASAAPFAGWIVAVVGADLVALDPDTGTRRTLAACAGSCRSITSPALSPDGRKIAFIVARERPAGIPGESPAPESIEIGVVDLASPGPPSGFTACADARRCSVFPSVVPGAGPLLWSSDGARIAFDDGFRRWSVRADGSDRTLLTLDYDIAGALGRAGFRAPERTPVDAPPEAIGAAASPVGSAVAWIADPLDPRNDGTGDPYVAQLWVRDEGAPSTRLLAERPGCCIGGWVDGPVWSPDGTRIAWAGTDGSNGGSNGIDLLVFDLGGGDTLRFTGLAPISPIWIPDAGDPARTTAPAH